MIKAEIPGVNKGDNKGAIDGNLVSISAEMKQESEEKQGQRLIRSERHYGRVARSLRLDEDVDQGAAHARSPETPAFRPGSAPTALKGGVSNRSQFYDESPGVILADTAGPGIMARRAGMDKNVRRVTAPVGSLVVIGCTIPPGRSIPAWSSAAFWAALRVPGWAGAAAGRPPPVGNFVDAAIGGRHEKEYGTNCHPKYKLLHAFTAS